MNNRIELRQGDITEVRCDAIVNAANASLLGGGGVDGAIHRAGGPAILAECKAIVRERGPLPTGQAVITTAGKLPARFVIHTVGPVWSGNDAEEQERELADCYRNSLQLALEKGCNTVAFPNISTGVYHFPKERAAQVAIGAVREFLQAHDGPERVIFVCFDAENYQLYQQRLPANS